MCEESIKQRDPKDSPLCQLGFQAQVGRLQFCTLVGGACLTGGLQPFRNDLLLALPSTHLMQPPPPTPGTFKYSQGQQPLTDACARLAKLSTEQAGVN